MAASLLVFAPAAGWGAAAPSGVGVFPIPGSLVASPQAQIAFRGIPSSQLESASIQVSGSRSGVHTGVVEADSDGDGGSFIPSTPFQPGETVTVTTSLDVLGGTAGAFHFIVATPAGVLPYQKHLTAGRVPGDVWRFRSRPDLAPAAVRVLKRTSAAGGADIFVAPQYGPVQDGPEILDSHGRLVWFDRVAPGDMATDFEVQSYDHQPVLTWWQGYSSAGVGIGQDMIYNSFYRPVAVVHAADGVYADLHDFEITPWGTALITAYYPVYWSAASVHGPKKEIVFDSIVQEIDIPTGLLLFEWDSLDHVPLRDSYQPVPAQGAKHGTLNPYDYFHVNSVVPDSDRNFVISARDTWAAYKVNHQTGAIMWTLGGKASSFRMGPGSAFAFQHDVGLQGPGDQLVTVFDDGGGPPNVHPQSRGLELALDFTNMTARLVSQDEHSPPLLADFEGDFQQLPDADRFIGWGQQPYFTEYDSRGRQILDGRFVGDTATYRAYLFPWSGTPAFPPAVVASTSRRTTTVYVSWNGATAVGSWRVESGRAPKKLRTVATVRKRGFETAIKIPAARYVCVQALGGRGGVVGNSATVRVR